MSDHTANCWTLAAPIAHLHIGPLTATLDLTHPQRGLHGLKLGEATLNGASVLGVDLPLQSIEELSLPETYVRGGDLVAVYTATAARPWRVQTYWRVVDAAIEDAVVVELQVSINTGLLDVQPAVDVVGSLPGAKQQVGGDKACFALGSSSFDYWQVVHPDDPCTTRTQSMPDGVQLAQRLFDRFLEKGVILRSRIRGAFVPHGAATAAIFQEFAAAPLPLTT
jgi:hypothetical protein